MKKYTPFILIAVMLLCIAVIIACSKDEDEAVQPQVYYTATTFADLAGHTVGVVEGTVHQAYVEANCPDADVEVYPSNTALFAALSKHKVDFVVADSVAVLGTKNSQNVALQVVLNDAALSGNFAVAFNKDNVSLRDSFNVFFNALRSGDDIYQYMLDQWVYGDPSAAVMPTEKASGTDTLYVGLTLDVPPFQSLSGAKQYRGLEIELVNRFGARMGRPVWYVVSSFAPMMSSLEAGDVDMAVGCITVSAERSSHYLFSDPYFQSNSAVYAIAE